MQPKLFISIDYCLLVYSLWMVYDFENRTLITTDWWEDVAIEIDDSPRKAQRDPKPHNPTQLSLF